ncbi:MAG: MFS transporter [Candidatus Lokiarchaeota archaeon]|nr:MFS transporter [Candidatus Lokiarchaeota archaeon]MBD3339692.1 MFS transporter [Candidatus Lokiarchaeota archaeon]
MSETTKEVSKLDDWAEWHSSKKSMLSYSFGSFGIELVGNAFAGLYFFFYETELLLPGILLIIANTIFALYNAVNDPLIGYAMEKPRKFWARWGKRYPWLCITLIPMYVCYFLLFAPPMGLGPLALFFWMTVMLLLADTFYSAFFVQWQGMFPEKYKTDDARRKGNVYKLILAISSVIVGTLIPPQIYEYDVVESYALMAGVILIIGSIAAVFVMYGAREDPARRAQQVEEGAVKQQPFLKSFKNGVSNKAFLAYIFLYFGNKIWDLFVLGSANYYAKWILGISADNLTIIYAAIILGIFSAVPVFTYIAKKIGFYKTAVIGGFTESVLTIPLLFIRDPITSFLFFYIVGFGNGAMWAMLSPILAEALDSLAIQTGKRDSGVYVGVYVFFGRLAIILFTFLMVFVHGITDFNAAAPTGKGQQSALAEIGILITIGLIPILGTAIFTTLFALTYDIKGEKKIWLMEQIRTKELERG